MKDISMKARQVVWTIIIAFFVGGIGGIFLSRFALPYLSNFSGFNWTGKLITTSPIVINRREEVQLNEGVNLIDLIKQAGNATVGIYGSKNNFVGNGLIATSDGLILTTNSIIANQTSVFVVTSDGQKLAAALVSKDTKTNLVLLDIDANNLAVTQFDDATTLQTGQRVIYIGRSNAKFEHAAWAGFVTQSLANQLTNKQISTDAVLSADYFGSPIVNLNGRVVGLVLNASQNIIGEDLKKFLNDYLANKSNG